MRNDFSPWEVRLEDPEFDASLDYVASFQSLGPHDETRSQKKCNNNILHLLSGHIVFLVEFSTKTTVTGTFKR